MADNGWGALRLGDICTKIGSGATPRGGKEVYLRDGPCALIRSQNVHNDHFHHDGLAFIDIQQATDLDNVEVFADDVLLNITGDSVARACQVAPDVLPARVNQHVAIVRPDTDKLLPRYLRYFLVSPETQAMLLSWAGSGGTRNALTKGMIESFNVRAPMDIAEQRAIAHILGTLDDKIALNRRMNETLEAMARALFKDWFVDFGPTRAKIEGRDPYLAPKIWDLFPDALDDEGKPVGWSDDVLGSFTNLQNGYAFKSKDWRDCGVPVVKIGSVKPAFVDLGQVSFVDEALALEKAKFRLSSGDMLVGLTGYVGETGRVPPTQYTPMLKCNGLADSCQTQDKEPFVFSCVRQPEFKEFAESKSHGVCAGKREHKGPSCLSATEPGRTHYQALLRNSINLVQEFIGEQCANVA